MKKNTYYVTLTYLNTIEAESYEEAEMLTEEMIRDGDIVPNDIETKIVNGIETENINNTISQENRVQYNYEYNGSKFEFQDDVIDALVEDDEIFSFKDWLNDNYNAYAIYENCFEDFYPQYEAYQENMFKWCVQVGKVKELKIINANYFEVMLEDNEEIVYIEKQEYSDILWCCSEDPKNGRYTVSPNENKIEFHIWSDDSYKTGTILKYSYDWGETWTEIK